MSRSPPPGSYPRTRYNEQDEDAKKDDDKEGRRNTYVVRAWYTWRGQF